ncbi:DUF1289 domain-containing protein [Microvirga tunisiensis]|uniref:DUF1289 domain-containing protein n=2 Tax=Pannonibacter tanglangensis TaxID=2750084 RepID=A0ABW9ZIB9_9HYPH|nr:MULTISPECIES: DUF1289 domain-containing protein [unclassified Pannonibacter]NBN62460.1 DUF1289 domain-containing protein [Pannonibacter sp. XCT-34]NBN78116.1 DUF1289 domain-containing protein [Pannonibacter sp. XCT-53]
MPDMESPCVRICIMDPTLGLCQGCGRTLAEIATWGSLTAEARRAIMAGLPQRLAGLAPRQSTG